MKKIVLWSAVAFFCLALPHAGISGEAAPDTASARWSGILRIDGDNDGQTIFLRRGHFVNLNLIANPSTGYSWNLETLDEDVVASYCETCIPIPPVMEGSPCDNKWFFEAVGPGRTSMVLKYYRVWEGPSSTLDTFSVRFIVY